MKYNILGGEFGPLDSASCPTADFSHLLFLTSPPRATFELKLNINTCNWYDLYLKSVRGEWFRERRYLKDKSELGFKWWEFYRSIFLFTQWKHSFGWSTEGNRIITLVSLTHSLSRKLFPWRTGYWATFWSQRGRTRAKGKRMFLVFCYHTTK